MKKTQLLFLWHRFTFGDITPLLKRLNTSSVKREDIQNLPAIQNQFQHPSHNDYPDLEQALPNLRKSPLRATMGFERRCLWTMFIIQFCDVFLSLLGVYCSMELLRCFESNPNNSMFGILPRLIDLVCAAPIDQSSRIIFMVVLASSVFIFNVLSASLHAQKLEIENLVTWRVSSRLMNYMYAFLLQLSRSEKERIPSGDIINMAQSDVSTWANFLGHCFVDCFVLGTTTLSILIFLWLILGPMALLIVCVVWIQLPIVLLSSFLSQKIYSKQMKLDDNRMDLITEWIQAMRLVRYFGWSRFFEKDIEDNTKKEYRQGVKRTLASACAFSTTNSWWMVAASAVCAGALAWHVSHLAAVVFTSVWLINLLGNQLTPLPWFVNSWAESRVGNTRLKAFFSSSLQQEEFQAAYKHNAMCPVSLSTPTQLPSDYNRVGFSVHNVSVQFNNQNTPLFSNVSFKILPGTLTAFVGPVGCGKSVLMQILMGEFIQTQGDVWLDVYNAQGQCIQIPLHSPQGLDFLRARQSIVMQDAAIFSATLQDNITLFDDQAQNDQVQQALQAACFQSDLAFMPFGLDTLIGERGVNLSGGQKQRVSLARSHFSQAPVVFLDDPLSAVDIHTEKILAQNFLKITNQQTLIWSTHRENFLSQASQVLFFEEGTVVCKSIN